MQIKYQNTLMYNAIRSGNKAAESTKLSVTTYFRRENNGCWSLKKTSFTSKEMNIHQQLDFIFIPFISHLSITTN
jgi:hypothetical protein